MSGEPHPKSAQLARGERRYRRKVASVKQWRVIVEEKRGPCRCCDQPPLDIAVYSRRVQYHHLVKRSQLGDDVADNIVPLCGACHYCVEARRPTSLAALAASLSEAERSYVVGKLGEGGMERLFGVCGRG